MEALEDTAFFDLIAPPYAYPDLRPCTYYTMDEARLLATPTRQHPNMRILHFRSEQPKA